jgi:autotransporter-associated beta strand protein
LTVAGSGTVTLSGPNSYAGATTVSGTLSVAAAAALPNEGNLAIQSGGKVQLSSGVDTITLQSLSIAATGGLDLSNNELIIDYNGADPIASIAAYLKSGYAGGKWNGPGIFTSAAASEPGYGIGYADGTDGVVAGLSAGQIEIKYTLLGDANLDGEVNGTDFNIMATNFNKTVSGWDKGDFDYSGSVNGSDFVLLADNFNQYASQSAVAATDLEALDAFAAANGLLAYIPEPAAGVIVMAVMFAGLSTGRRRYFNPALQTIAA